jgi:hypothetical protein
VRGQGEGEWGWGELEVMSGAGDKIGVILVFIYCCLLVLLGRGKWRQGMQSLKGKCWEDLAAIVTVAKCSTTPAKVCDSCMHVYYRHT